MLSTSNDVRSFRDLLGELCCEPDETDGSGANDECDSWQEAGEWKKELVPNSVSLQGSSCASWLNNTWSGIGCSLKQMERISQKVL